MMKFNPEQPKERIVADYNEKTDGDFDLSVVKVLSNFESDDTVPEWARRKIVGHLREKHIYPWNAENNEGSLRGFKVTERGNEYEVEVSTVVYNGTTHVERTHTATFKEEE